MIENNKMKNILVTGANGQLGNEMRVVADGQTTVTYHFTDVAELDICDIDAIERMVSELGVCCIVNCAAYTNVNKAEEDVELCDKLNHQAPANLAQVAERHGIELIHVSTDYVFNGCHYRPYRENDATCPNSVYGSTKLAGEEAILHLCSTAAIIRTAWLYSEFGKNFCRTMLQLTAERPTLQVVYDQCGTPTYALDLASAILAVLQDYKVTLPSLTGTAYPKSGIYHYSNLGVCSWYDFTQMIQHIANELVGMDVPQRECKIMPCLSSQYPSPVKRPAYSVLDKSKIQDAFNLEIPYWTDSLRMCLQNLISQI
jgi:dTDP-4-dehydrorhamnose reductase